MSTIGMLDRPPGELYRLDYAHGFLARLLVFALRNRIENDPGARIDVCLALLNERGADCYCPIHVSLEVEIADDARIDPAPLRLELCQKLHRPDLGRARHRAPGKAALKDIEAALALSQRPRDLGSQVHNVRVSGDSGDLSDRDRPRPADAAEIVAPEVDQHPVLGQLLLVGAQLRGKL